MSSERIAATPFRSSIAPEQSWNGRVLARMREAAAGFLSEAMFPHAAIWTASVIAKMVSKTDGGYFEPDPYATEAPFLADSWPTRW